MSFVRERYAEKRAEGLERGNRETGDRWLRDWLRSMRRGCYGPPTEDAEALFRDAAEVFGLLLQQTMPAAGSLSREVLTTAEVCPRSPSNSCLPTG